MRRALMLSPLFALTVFAAGQVLAQTPVPALRPVSPETAAKLAAAAPKFVPPATTTEEKPAVDLREIDKPKNGIIRLPAYLVQEPKVRAFKEREMLTPKGNLALALKRHPGLRFNPLFFLGSNDGIALAMLEEERRLERLAEMADLLSLMRYGDTPVSNDTKRMVQQAFMQPSDFGWQGGGPWAGLVVPWERK